MGAAGVTGTPRAAPVVPVGSRPAAAEHLAGRLRAAASLPGPSASPTVFPCDRTLLDWLRRMTHPGLYTWAGEENLARRWIGGDIFGTRRPADPPGFLAGTDVRRVPPRLVAPLLRRLSLTRPDPDPADLTPAALVEGAGPLSVHHRDAGARRWGQPDPVPLLAATTEIPRIVHGIWLGRPLPPSSRFWTSYGRAADHYAGEVDFVLWTDVSRARCHAARAPGGDPAVRTLLDWATAHGIHLVNVAEVFHAAAPMTLHTPYVLELARRQPSGFAAASDHLRVEIVHRFGGLYADGDLQLVSEVDDAPTVAPTEARYRLFRGAWTGPPDTGGPPRLPDLFDRVAASTYGFTVHAVADHIVLNDLVLAPAGHPALALWIEGARHNYLREQRELYPTTVDPTAPGEPPSWTWAATAMRSGRVHQWLLARLGLTGADLLRPAPAVGEHSELSWLPPVDGPPPVAGPDSDPLPTLVECVQLLRWHHLSRTGDLCLTVVAPLVRGLADPDTAWTALLLAYPDLSADIGPVTSVTDRRRNQDRSLDVVVLPPAAEALLDRTARPSTWFGTGAEYWFLDERTVPVGLPGVPSSVDDEGDVNSTPAQGVLRT